MFYIEVHNTINKIIDFYHLLGIWIRVEDTLYHKWGWKIFHLIISLSLILSLLFGALKCECFHQLIFLCDVTIGAVVLNLKLIYILLKKDEILHFIRSVAVHCIGCHQQFTQISKKLKVFMNFATFYCVMLFLIIVAFACVGLPIFSYEKNLPLNIVSPLDWRNNEISYFITYAYQMIMLAFHATYMLSMVIIWYIMFNCSIKYQIIEYEFINFGTTVTERNFSEAEHDTLLLQELIELIKTHQSIQEIIEGFKSCYDFLFFTQISTSGVCICGSIYVLAFSSHENVIQSIIYIFFILHNLFDIFMIMYLGNEIKLYSGRLSNGLFQSNWINQSQSCKKCILILMEVLTHPQELVIGLVYPLNLETLTSILKFTYSSFNILQNLK